MIRVAGKISEIVPEGNATWTQRLFLTIDID
jgi:serine protease inhibitor